jgi:hypothetical protein
MGLLHWLHQQMRRAVRRDARSLGAPPWHADLLGDARLRQVERRRDYISQMVRSMKDEVEAITREREHGA